ncbi:BTB/POZ domain protein TNFAIP protein [Thalictrum thalictroides]|uniref:BTB/POZ domain protein TNFAIP protein n=1 Tax=Thalictrum thalictroides TaxID=46969 RepID=A0A7J6WGL7_THATH|nr:BTB/POZ domain protein TNFAIP protein [Thalictrum thalictroides]
MASFTLSNSASSRPWVLKTTTSSFFQTTSLSSSCLSISRKTQIPISIKINTNRNTTCCSAAKQQKESSVKKHRNTTPKKKGLSKSKESDDSKVSSSSVSNTQSYQPASLPKPPAGFVLDPNGNVVLVSSKRMVTIVDSTNNLPLECIIRRVFRSSQGDDCMLLCPVDTPVQILKSTNVEGWSAVSDEEVEVILPAAAYALAKIHMHLVYSGFCYTARGGFCYSEEDIFEFGTDDGQDVDGLPTEGVQITCFHQDSTNYMIYTPSDPLLFVAVKDNNGLLRIADDDLLEDSAIVDAIDEETEFNALVEEEAALLESLLEEQE